MGGKVGEVEKSKEGKAIIMMYYLRKRINFQNKEKSLVLHCLYIHWLWSIDNCKLYYVYW